MIGLLVSIATNGVAPVLAVAVAWLNQRKRLSEIHVLVNNRLETALTKIDDLQKKVEQLKDADRPAKPRRRRNDRNS